MKIAPNINNKKIFHLHDISDGDIFVFISCKNFKEQRFSTETEDIKGKQIFYCAKKKQTKPNKIAKHSSKLYTIKTKRNIS